MGIPGDILSDQVLCEQWTVTPKLTERVNHTWSYIYDQDKGN